MFINNKNNNPSHSYKFIILTNTSHYLLYFIIFLTCPTRMYIVFVIDTSASMNQRSSTGMTLLDCAKSAVEHFLKIRGRDTSIRNDRFFLITTEDGPSAVKVLLFLSLSPSFLSFLLHLRGDVPIGRDDYYWRVPEYPSFSLSLSLPQSPPLVQCCS